MRWGLAVCMLVVGGSACRPPGVDPTVAGFEAKTKELDFGKHLEGTRVVRQVTLAATGRSAVTVTPSTSLPFATVDEVVVPGSGTVEVDVTFTAGATEVVGTLTLTSATGVLLVPLKGKGVKPITCVPTVQCRASSFSLELEKCVEVVLPDLSSCQPDSLCLEKGVCEQGVCRGSPRSCDDGNKCTVDSCAPDVGCVQSPVVCPTPANPCHVATCDPGAGCGEGNASDGTVCGSTDCVAANLCVFGGCMKLDTPEGFLCGPKTTCREESRCKNKVCTAPDQFQLKPQLTVFLPGEVAPGPILEAGGNVYLQLCGLPPEAVDAGQVDAGTVDGGAIDGGGLDGGGPDAGMPDAGPVCGLVSFTPNGFDRWLSRLDSRPAQLNHVSERDAWLARPDGLTRATALRGYLTEVPLDAGFHPLGVASGAGATVRLVRDGQLLTVRDAGIEEAIFVDGGVELLALDEAGAAWLYGPDSGQLLKVTALSDGGRSVQQWPASPGAASLITASGIALAGMQWLTIDDGGVVALEPPIDAGVISQMIERSLLADNGTGVVFESRCADPFMSCAPEAQSLFLRTFSLLDGHTTAISRATREGAAARLVEAALVAGGGLPVASVVEEVMDGGVQSLLHLQAADKLLMECEFLPGKRFSRAVFSQSRLFTLTERDGGHVLETYDLRVNSLRETGWPQANALSGTRRAR